MTPSLDDILSQERRVWEALKAGDAALDANLLADGFVGVYPSGFSTKQGHCAQLDGGPTVASYDLEDARLQILTDDLALLSYRATWVRIGGSAAETMYVTSLWQRTGGVWKNAFSQDSPAV